MNKTLLTGNEAGAWGGRLARADVIPTFPITPQTELIETIAQWIADGEMDSEYVQMESEHSVMSAAIGAEASGARAFTATSSQGINVSRGLSSPITLWADQNDVLAQRDAGWLQYHCMNNQEVLDTVIQAYKIAENKKVLLPVIINMDGFVLSYTREPTLVPEQAEVDKFLPRYEPTHALLDPEKPNSMGGVVLGEYMRFREQHHLAAENAQKVTRDVEKEFAKRFGRKYSAVEWYGDKDADNVLVTTNSMSTSAIAAVGKNQAVMRIRMLRPFPEKEIQKMLEGARNVGVVDRDVAPGEGGIIYPEIRSALFDSKKKPRICSYIAGLGGRPVSKQHFEHMFKKVTKPKDEWIY
jgi:pyruvate ferredoxin oxidoreductase alpha subunit